MLVLLFSINQAISKKPIVPVNLWIGIITFFCIIEVSSVSWSVYYSYDIKTIERLFAQYIAPVVVTSIALNLFNSEKKYHEAIKYLLVSALFLAGLAVSQVFFSFQTLFSPENVYETYRASATFRNANALAVFLVLTIPHMLYGISREVISKKIGWTSIAIIFVGIICTVSRKGIITAWIVLFLYFILKKDFKKIVRLGLATAVAIMIFSGYTLFSQRFTADKMETQVIGKHAMVMAGVDMFLKNPIIGSGYQGYSENFGKYFRRYDFSDPKKFDSHNIFITVLVNYGLLGFFSFMWIFLYPLFISFRTLKRDSLKYSKEVSTLCIVSIVPFIMNGFYSGGLLDFWPIMMMFYTNVVLLFSLIGNSQKVLTPLKNGIRSVKS
jgi:O-antigen ligase